ncbi:MAG: RNA polymerase sigma factor [Candidatus Eremiobacteraeota bacterium]|nr:RNA polymerase sigma factor [Candidatus Eremiobacteraeota bacterium]
MTYSGAQIAGEGASKDEEIIDKVLKSRDKNTFELVVERFKKPVMTIAYRMTGNYEASVEIAQETFIKAWSYLRSYRHEMRFSSWLFKIAANEARDFLTQRHREIEHESPLEDKVAAQFQNNWEEKAEGGLMVQSLLSDLREPYKTAVILRFMEDLTYEEIAAIMECSIEQVKNYLFRGKKYLLTLAREGTHGQ